jgi:hypothetical protein
MAAPPAEPPPEKVRSLCDLARPGDAITSACRHDLIVAEATADTAREGFSASACRARSRMTTIVCEECANNVSRLCHLCELSMPALC